MKKKNVDNDKIFIIIQEIGEEDRTIEDLKKDYPDEIEKLEEVLLKNIGENGPKILKTELPEKWKYLAKKLGYPCEYFSSVDDYQKAVNDLKKEDFFSKLKDDYLNDLEIERTKEHSKLFDVKYRKGLAQLYLKSDVLLLTCVFEKFIKVSTNEYGI